MPATIKIAVTGAAGQIDYSLLFRLASGETFGSRTQVELQLIEIEPALPALEGVVMELNDCAFPLLRKISITSDPNQGFSGANWVLLVGAAPRKAGMERGDLIKTNSGIFVDQGSALNRAASDVRILVVGNPCNTNCLIAMNNAKDIPRERWFAMTALDANRARFQLAQKSGYPVREVSNLTIWGNHSATQYPDFYNAKIAGNAVMEVIPDLNWLQNDFISTVQKRGAVVIEARGASSAASAANAVVDTIQNLTQPTAAGDWFSAAVPSEGNYGVPQGLVFGFPLSSNGSRYEIVPGIEWNEFAREKIRTTLKELEEEYETVKNML